MSKEFLKNLIIKIEATFGSIRDASKVLNVDYTTLWRWKNGAFTQHSYPLFSEKVFR